MPTTVSARLGFVALRIPAYATHTENSFRPQDTHRPRTFRPQVMLRLHLAVQIQFHVFSTCTAHSFHSLQTSSGSPHCFQASDSEGLASKRHLRLSSISNDASLASPKLRASLCRLCLCLSTSFSSFIARVDTFWHFTFAQDKSPCSQAFKALCACFTLGPKLARSYTGRIGEEGFVNLPRATTKDKQHTATWTQHQS